MQGPCIPRQRISSQCIPGRCIPGLIGLLCVSLCLTILPSLHAQEPAHTTRIEISHGKPFVMVYIDNRGPFRFIVDTGTGGQAFISPALAAQLNLTQIGHMHITDPSGRGSRTTPLMLIPSLKVAGVEFTGVQAAVHEIGDSDGTCQGLLGFKLFQSYLLTLDYPHHQLQLASGSLAPDGEQSVLPFHAPSGIPVIALHVDNTIIDTQIDSGGAGLSLPEALASHMAFSSDPVSFSNSFSIATRFQIKAGRLAGAIRFGSYTFEQPFVEINPAFPVANFGAVPMQNFAVTFDQQNKLVRFDSTRQTLHLSATPTPMHLDNSPPTHPPDQALVPVG
jgi:predicted aspartyl protease